jgi:hypothetical protein
VELSSIRRWFRKPIALVVAPLVVLAYLGAWAAQGNPPLFPASECSPASGPSVTPGSPSPSATPTTGDGRLSLTFGFRPDPLQPDAPVAWDFTVTNVSGEPVSMTFGSGQDGDVVLSQSGEEKYRWSQGRVFTQAIRTEDLAPGESRSFTLDDTLPVEPGSYELVASVASEPAPAPAQRMVTVGSSSSPEPSPGTPSPEPSPSTSPSPSPQVTSSPRVVPEALPPPVRRRRRNRWARRWPRILFGIVMVLAVSATSFGAVQAQTEAGSGGKNVVIVINETDERTAGRAGVLVGHASGPSAVPENLASARASCTDCRTVAVALQSVVITSYPDYASPRNAAVAVNANCTRCQTLAYAWQYVVSTGGPVRITPEGEAAVADIRTEAASLSGSDLPFTELVAELDTLAAEFRGVMDREVERVGGRGVADRAVKIDDQC